MAHRVKFSREGAIMASREKVRQIDAQWQALQPGLGRKNHNGERKMLHEE